MRILMVEDDAAFAQATRVQLMEQGFEVDICGNGSDLGADDYLVKPFAFGELMARIRCVLRRPPVLKTGAPQTVGDLIWIPADAELRCRERSCTLTARERALFELFAAHPGKTLSRTFLLSEVWGDTADVEMGNLDNFIYFLRNRLRGLGSAVAIRTVR